MSLNRGTVLLCDHQKISTGTSKTTSSSSIENNPPKIICSSPNRSDHVLNVSPNPSTHEGIRGGSQRSSGQIISVHSRIGPDAKKIFCRKCGQTMKTNISLTPTALTYCIAFGMMFGCCLCACLPFYVSNCNEVQHRCSSCKSYLGTYQPCK